MQIQNPVNQIGGVNPLVEQAMDQVLGHIQGYSMLANWSGAQILALGGNMDLGWQSLTTEYTGPNIVPTLVLTAAKKIRIPPETTGRWTISGALTANLAVGLEVTFSVVDDAGVPVTEGQFPATVPLQGVATKSSIIAGVTDLAKSRTDTGYTLNVNVKALAAATISNVYIRLRKFL